MAYNEEVILRGKAGWNHTKRPNKYGDWVVQIYPDKESMEKVHALLEKGIKNKLAKDEENRYHISFKRPQEKKDRQGKVFRLDPPIVMNKDKTLFSEQFFGRDSDIAIKLETYGGNNPMGGKYWAARLSEVKIDTLVPYKTEASSLDNLSDPKEDW
jgi:hypothetical protein